MCQHYLRKKAAHYGKPENLIEASPKLASRGELRLYKSMVTIITYRIVSSNAR